MAKLKLTRFSAYELTPEEELNGQTLNGAQKVLLQTEQSQIAEQILNLDFEPSDPLKFAQNEAFLRGQLSVYQVMLDRSELAEQSLRSLAAQSLQPPQSN